MTLDVIEAMRATVDAVDLLVEHALRTAGSVEAQRAEVAARKARLRLDALTAEMLKEAG